MKSSATSSPPTPSAAQKPQAGKQAAAAGSQASAGGQVIQCGSCGKKLKVPASAVGKQVRCPGCQKVMAVPAAKGGAVAAAAGPAASSPVTSSPPASTSPEPSPFGADFGAASPPASDPFGSASPFDDLPAGNFPGPATSPSPYSQPLSAPTPAQNPYAVTSSSAPKRWSSGGDGQPWSAGKSWGAVGISFFGSFAAVALSIAFLPPAIGVGLAILGYGGGGLVATVAGIWLLVIAFQEDVVQGLLCLFVPLYIVYYMFRDWERTWLPTVTYWIGTLAMFGCIGGFLGGSLIGAMIFGVPE